MPLHPDLLTPPSAPPWWRRHALLLAVLLLGAIAWWAAPDPADTDLLPDTARPARTTRGESGRPAPAAPITAPITAPVTPQPMALAGLPGAIAPAALPLDQALAAWQGFRPPLADGTARGLFGPATPPAAASAPAPPPPTATPVVATLPPAPPALTVQALGVLRPRGEPPQALLQRADGEVLVRRAGEAIDATWRLEAIGPQHLDLVRQDGTHPQRLPVQPGD